MTCWRSGILLLLCLPGVICGAEVQLTKDGRWKTDPVWQDAGQTLLYTVECRPTQMQIMRQPLAGGEAEPLNPQQTNSEFDPAISPDGRYVALVQSRGNLSLALVIRDLNDGKEAVVEPAGGFSGMQHVSLTYIWAWAGGILLLVMVFPAGIVGGIISLLRRWRTAS